MPGAGPSGGYLRLPSVLGGFFCGPERAVSHSIHRLLQIEEELGPAAVYAGRRYRHPR